MRNAETRLRILERNRPAPEPVPIDRALMATRFGLWSYLSARQPNESLAEATSRLAGVRHDSPGFPAALAAALSPLRGLEGDAFTAEALRIRAHHLALQI